ncbi:MAG: branched-chain-amino-acid transaminase [Chlamydiae bacterium]|nr:branched-chain-amino-acid transaminase [Chlamydiota bacterium]MBI3278125.1 branched-chain-amino-acid transaminase [Chlamydiota bacterium]
MKVYINGQFFKKEEAKISVYDHGFLYGDGVFEGIRVYKNKIFKLEEHMDRLYESAKTILLTIPVSKKELIEAVIASVLENPYHDAYIRLVVTRGVGSLGLDPNQCSRPQIIIIVDKIALYSEETYQDGMHVITVATRRNWAEGVNPRVKSLNYLNNILAKIEALHAGYQEAIMLNQNGFVAECTGDNIFILKQGKLMTPSLENGFLDGITRNAVMDLALPLGFEVSAQTLSRHDLYNADECFLTGTAAEVVPVVNIDGRVIGNGKPGSHTLAIAKAYKELTAREGVMVRKSKIKNQNAK